MIQLIRILEGVAGSAMKKEKQMKKLIKKNRTYRFAVIRCIITFIVVFLFIFGIYIIVTGKNEQKKESQYVTELHLAQMSKIVDMRLKDIENYYYITSSSSNLERILKSEAYYSDDSALRDVSKELLGGNIYRDFISDFILIDLKNDIVLDESGARTFDEYPGSYDIKKELLTESQVRRYWKKGIPGEIEYVIKLPIDSVTTTAIAVIEINTGSITGITGEILVPGEKMYVLDETDNVVFASEEPNHSKISSYMKDLKKKDTALIENEKYTVKSVNSAVVDWTYVLFSPQRDSFLVKDNDSFVWILVIVSLVGALFMVSVYYLYRPVEKMIKNIGEVGDESADDSVGDLEYIEKKVTNLSEDKDRLKNMVNHQENKIQQMFELRLINDGIRSEEEWDDYFESLNLPKYECFATTVAVLDVRYDSAVQKSLDEDAICLQIIDDMPKDVRNLLWMPPVYNSCTIFSLIGANDENDLFEKTKDYFTKMEEYAVKTTGFHIMMGVSGTHREHKKIRRAYRESASALMQNVNKEQDYHKIEQKILEEGIDTSQSLRFYVDKLPSGNEVSEGFNTKYENDIRIAIKEADVQKAYKVTDRFAEFLLNVKTTDDTLYYVLRYLDQIIQMAFESNITLSEIFPNGIRTTYREIIAEIEPRRVRKAIKQYFIDPVILCMNEHMQNGAHQVMEQIDALMVRTHGNILLSECADELGLNQNYIWKVLKMERGRSFTEYAEKYKIEEAKKMLLETNLSVQEMAAKLDYANAQNFIRFFSKATGITPGKFRKMY